MEENKKIALILKELMKWDSVVNCLIDSDYEPGKSYDFDASEAIDTINKFIEENLE